jgi:hypothetical protein
MIHMQRLLVLFMLVFSPIVYGQKKKQPVIRYKTIFDNTFSIGDRIDMGEIEVVLLPLGKDSIVIPDSLEMYRDFIQNNRFVTFKLHMNWKLQGVKYPGRTDRTRDALLTYLNNDGTEQDSVCDINYFKHTFVKKQVPVLRIELEVIDLKAPNMHGTVINGVIGMPEMNMLYRNYNNLIEVGVGGIHDHYWIEGYGVILTAREGHRGQFIGGIPGGTGKTASIAVKTVNGQDTVTLAAYQYRISNLPMPTIYWGTLEMEQIKSYPDSLMAQMAFFFAKYPAQIPLKVNFEGSPS